MADEQGVKRFYTTSCSCEEELVERMRIELHGKEIMLNWIDVDVCIGDDEDNLRAAGTLRMTRDEWDVFASACEMGGNEAGIDIIAYTEASTIK